jgi:hypothetical protein
LGLILPYVTNEHLEKMLDLIRADLRCLMDNYFFHIFIAILFERLGVPTLDLSVLGIISGFCQKNIC